MDMCIQGMHWGLLYILQETQPHTFDELVTRAHNIKIVLKTNASKNMSIEELEENTIRDTSITNEDEESVTSSNFTAIIFKPWHSIMLKKMVSPSSK